MLEIDPLNSENFMYKVPQNNNKFEFLSHTMPLKLKDINPNLKIRFAIIYTNKRILIIKKLESDLQIKCERWPAVFTKSCPININYSKYAKKICTTCRGLSIAHKEIWDDFKKSDSDYIVIFEDDAEIESEQAIDLFFNKLNNLSADITYLGHCFGHLCLHSYVLNKYAVRILLDHVRTCGTAIDEQISDLITDGSITAEFVENKNCREHWTQGFILQSGVDTKDGSYQEYEAYEDNKNFKIAFEEVDFNNQIN